MWLYVAVEPESGRTFFLLLPWVNGDCLEYFLEAFQEALPQDESVVLVLDNAPSHQSEHVNWPGKIRKLPLPPYSPELNPAEQIFRVLRGKLSNRVFDSLDELQDTLCQAVNDFAANPAQVSRLTFYPWWPKTSFVS